MSGYYADNAYNRRMGRAGLPKGSMPISREGVFLTPRTYTSNSYTRLDRELSQFSSFSGLLNSYRSSDSDSGFGSSFSSSFSSPRQNPSHSDAGTSFSSPRQNLSHSDGGTSFSSPRQNTSVDSPSRFTAHLRDSSIDSGIGSSFSSPFNSPQRTPDRNDVSWSDEYNKWTQLKIHEEDEKIASKHEQQWQVMNLTDEILMRELQQLQVEEIEKWTEFKMKTEKEKEDIFRRNQNEDLHSRKKKFSLNLVELQQEEMEKWTIWLSKVEYEAEERKKRQKHASEMNTPSSEFQQFCQDQCGNQALLEQMPESTLMSQHHESKQGFQNITNKGSEYQETMRFIHTGIENFDLQSNTEDENVDNTLNKTTLDSSPHSDFTNDNYVQNLKPSTSYQVGSSHYLADTHRPKPVQKKKSRTTNNDASSSYLKARRKSNDHGKEIRFSHPEHSLKLHTSAINERQFKNSRHKALNDRKDMTKTKSKIASYTMKGYTGIVVDVENIEMIRPLSVQGFCIAQWNDTIVVAKMIDVLKVSERTTTKFQDEILLSSAIEHSNIVKFLGASIIHPNLCILTEFMQTNLYEALHIKENIKFLEWEKVKLMQQVASGLEYLHKKDIAHCNLETLNVLLHYTPGSSLVAKLRDFSHSVKMLNETEEKYMRADQKSRYSAPEVLCEDYVNMKFLKMADVYSFSLIIFEVIFEQEPFQTLDISEAEKQIRESGLTPTIPRNVCVNKTLLSFIVSGWNRDPTQRPTIRHFANYCLGMDHIYTKSNTQDKNITIYFYFCLCFIGFLCLDEFIFDIMSTCSIVMLFMFVLSCIILFRSSSVKLTNTRC
ncbi:Hypothetical predicted protein [Mytilus galloprovincialis]|uniref:Protein kinase domain-containing protein n=1 Tax=Mytilus galloprovincialis TaxID=29158 RepID=A0A8B6DI33_MYTGA|nr:Hypothetical predicted protein [Mytilus galloprovincialis]